VTAGLRRAFLAAVAMTGLPRLGLTGILLTLPAVLTTALANELPKLEPGKPAELACETKSVVVATDAAKATRGRLRLKLELSAADAKPGTGTWSISGVDAEHKGSLAVAQAEPCTKGCPLVAVAGGELQLWAPAVKGIDKLAADELLLLAVVKPDGRLRASTFRGQQIEALEEGACGIGAAGPSERP
jgi:hypothetical protein